MLGLDCEYMKQSPKEEALVTVGEETLVFCAMGYLVGS
jgi:hypothetical protein